MKKLKAANALYNKKVAAEKRNKTAREKEEHDRRKAEERKAIEERKAERARKKEERDREKASRITQKGKRKLPRKATVRKKQNRGNAAARSVGVVHEPPKEPEPTFTSHGRKTGPPRKLW